GKAKWVLSRKQLVVYLQPKTRGAVEKWGQVMMACVSYVTPFHWGRCPAALLEHGPRAPGVLGSYEQVDISHRPVSERGVGGVREPRAFEQYCFDLFLGQKVQNLVEQLLDLQHR